VTLFFNFYTYAHSRSALGEFELRRTKRRPNQNCAFSFEGRQNHRFNV